MQIEGKKKMIFLVCSSTYFQAGSPRKKAFFSVGARRPGATRAYTHSSPRVLSVGCTDCKDFLMRNSSWKVTSSQTTQARVWNEFSVHHAASVICYTTNLHILITKPLKCYRRTSGTDSKLASKMTRFVAIIVSLVFTYVLVTVDATALRNERKRQRNVDDSKLGPIVAPLYITQYDRSDGASTSVADFYYQLPLSVGTPGRKAYEFPLSRK